MANSPRLPTGTVTFLFTDIEGSTRLWEAHPDTMRDALAAHDAIFRETVPRNNGVIFKTVGDAVCAAFERPDDALRAAVESQRQLTGHVWPDDIGVVRVRMGIHTGMAQERDDDYFGPAVNRVARFMSIAHGGQILVSGATHELLRHASIDVMLRELGEHRLKDLSEPEAAFQVVAAGLLADFPSLTSLDAQPNNLPASISNFVGRVRELNELRTALTHERLVTIVGAGGIGKTRLALQLAADVVRSFRDGAWIVELAPIDDAGLIAQTIAHALRLREQPESTIDEQLVDHLHAKKLLLVLDNSEHLLAETARLTKTLLSRCPGLVVVATSREPLFLTGEHVFRLAALALDGDGPSEAVELFVARAQGMDASITPGAVAAIDRICRRLEGIPLAIELAAARSTALSLDDIEARLSNRLALLVSRDSTRGERHRTLRATIDWSYQLLTPEERRFARAVSAFEGGFTIAAAESVAGVADAADLLESLHNKSLIASVRGASHRYVITDMIGDYLHEALTATGENDAVAERHFAYWHAAVEAGSKDSAPEARAGWIKSIDAEAANVRVALQWGLVYRLDDTVKFAIALATYWQFGGHFIEAETWLARLLAKPEIADVDRAPLLRRASTFATMRSQHEHARELIVAARNAYERLADRSGVAETTYNIAVIEHRLGNAGVAEERYVEALAAFEATNHLMGRIRTSMNLVLLALDRHDLTLAETQLVRAEAAATETDDGDIRSDLAGLRATLLRNLGSFAEAIALYQTIISQKRELGNRYAVADLLLCVAEASIYNDDVHGAIDALREVFQIETEIGATAHVITAFEAAAEALARLSLDARAAQAHNLAERLRAKYGFLTSYTWDNGARERLLRERAHGDPQILHVLNDVTDIDWPAALSAGTMLDGLVDTKTY
jgi:predicted ATPase/class 3 adenylate cyclase